MGSQNRAALHGQSRSTTSQPQNTTANGNGLVGNGGLARLDSLARQTSIYSLTFDELQNQISDPGKGLGSMNMDDFLKNIWTAEESQAMASAMAGTNGIQSGSSGDGLALGSLGGLGGQTSLARQPSMALPRTLSRKTVDEVWQDIHNQNLSEGSGAAGSGGDAANQQRQMTLGEITLEEFLLKAGVYQNELGQSGGSVGQENNLFPPFATYVGNSTNGASDQGENRTERMGPGSLAATLSLSPANALTTPTSMSTTSAMDVYKQGHAQQHAQQQAQYRARQQQEQAQAQVTNDWYRMQQQQQQFAQLQAQAQVQAQAQAEAVAYGNAMSKRVPNGAMMPTLVSNGGYAGMANALAPGLGQMSVSNGLVMGLGNGTMNLALGSGSPPSSISDGRGHTTGNVLNMSPAGNYGMDRSRKREEGPGEKTVERRQKRMIKNRESAARSRARKQAYTVELEAEVTILKEENRRLKKLQVFIKSGGDEMTKRSLRRTVTGPW